MNPKLLSLLLVPVMTLAAQSSEAAENSPIKIGDAIPAVTCPDQDGKPVELAKAGAKGLTLVYFYPKADTPGCTKQGCSLRDGWPEITKRSIAVYGVSVDTPADQKAFKEKYRLPFTLLADKEKVVTKAFQSPSLSVAIGYAKRQAYLFEDGKCIMADYSAPTTDQAAKVIKFLDERKK
jgi:thioredoxin-dependent peroxiredoxin